MKDLAFTFLAWNAAIAIAIAALLLLKQIKINIKWLIFSFILFLIYVIPYEYDPLSVPLNNFFGKLHWNWSAKLFASSITLTMLCIMVYFSSDVTAKGCGFTLKQNEKSIIPALLAALLAIIFTVALELFIDKDGPSLGSERLLFQAIMPGIDEEMWFRGIFLASTLLAIKSKTINFLGTPMGWASLIAVLPFGVCHGISYEAGEWTISLYRVLTTGLIGFILLWIRQRTGSILIPILAHNSVNFIGSFF